MSDESKIEKLSQEVSNLKKALTDLKESITWRFDEIKAELATKN